MPFPTALKSLFDFFSAFDTSHPRQMIDIQYGIAIMSGREVSRPYRVWFFAEDERFLSLRGKGSPRKFFGDLRGLVIWMPLWM